jgi:hypothetical protein
VNAKNALLVAEFVHFFYYLIPRISSYLLLKSVVFRVPMPRSAVKAQYYCLQSSESKNKPSRKPTETRGKLSSASADLLLAFFFNPEDGGDIKISRLLP